MPEITVVAETGRQTGSGPTGRLRSEGKIPGILYGHGIEPIPLAVDGRELRGALNSEAGVNALLNLKVDGSDHLAIARSLQRDPVRQTVIHVDFIVVSRDEVLRADVPVVLIGEAEAVNREGGVVSQEQFSITVHATPDRIPNNIEIDISGLEIGASIRLSDVSLPEGVTVDLDPESPLVTAQAPTVVEEEVEEGAEDIEGVEVAEEEGAEGEARDVGDAQSGEQEGES